ncbi:helix-turn-helix domain-containing protein [Snodgrassella alvi]|uniref:helix-turn-helix domain-containing protein n=1 Tax=Snodgrassella alvi TaxID=1196083 RepID=UPI001179ED7A
MKTLLTTADVASYLSLNPKVITEKARSGEIPAHKKIGRWYFFKEELDEWLKADADSALQEATHAKRSKTCRAEKRSASMSGKAAMGGTTHSQHQTDNAYAKLLGLKTNSTRVN